MMWARLIASVFLLAVGIISARSADEGAAAGLESCFQAARIADESVPNCQMIQPSDWTASGKRARVSLNAWSTCCPKSLPDSLLDLRRHEILEVTASGPPADAALPKSSSKQASPERPGGTGSSGFSTGGNLPQGSKGPPKAPGMTHRSCLRRLKRQLERSDQTSLPKQPSFPHDQMVRVVESVKQHRLWITARLLRRSSARRHRSRMPQTR